MGIVRNRVFANTYGAGAELDAYNAAFRIPEIALDVLVAAGLTAPFVPIFTACGAVTTTGAANEFGRTVITGGRRGVADRARADLPGGAVAGDRSSSRASIRATQDLYVQLLRINCFAQVMFAASICLGEILVANRRFLPYALAPILYTTGIIVGDGAVRGHVRHRRHGLGRGRRRHRPPRHPGRGTSGPRSGSGWRSRCGRRRSASSSA